MNYRLTPSLLSADFTELGSQIELLKSLGVRALHCDIMDGDFVPSISFGMPVLKSLRKRTDLYLDAHLMVTEPDRYIDAFVEAGRGRHTVHAEACRHLDRTVQHIKACGKKAAVALNPATPLVVLEDILPELDMVLIMSVNPGSAGRATFRTARIRFADCENSQIENIRDFRFRWTAVLTDRPWTKYWRQAQTILSRVPRFRRDIADNVAFFHEGFQRAAARQRK